MEQRVEDACLLMKNECGLGNHCSLEHKYNLRLAYQLSHSALASVWFETGPGLEFVLNSSWRDDVHTGMLSQIILRPRLIVN